MYSKYQAYVKAITGLRDLSSFKRSNTYREILEHVSPELGEAFFAALEKTPISRADLRAFCMKNDSVGKPLLHSFGPDFEASPTSLRYAFHAHLVLAYLRRLGSPEPVPVIEVGGGYGGLYVAIDTFAPLYGVKIASYTIIDLPEIIELQRQYTGLLPTQTPLTLLSAETYGADAEAAPSSAFLVSNYAFSELAEEHRKGYERALFPKLQHGFLAWNSIPVYDFGFPTIVLNETPLTGDQFNKYVYF
jgi:hypothetical protein